jgi:hypothetical protein
MDMRKYLVKIEEILFEEDEVKWRSAGDAGAETC